MSYWKEDPSGVLFILHVLPNAKKTEIVGLHGTALKVKIHAPPVDGKANAEILTYFQKLLIKGEGPVHLISGDTSKTKKIKIENAKFLVLKDRLGLP